MNVTPVSPARQPPTRKTVFWVDKTKIAKLKKDTGCVSLDGVPFEISWLVVLRIAFIVRVSSTAD